MTDPLETSREWQALESARREAEEIASGARGSFPFDAQGQKDLLARLQRGVESLGVLIAQDLLHFSEAGLVRTDLERLAKSIRGFRPTEMERCTCYRAVLLDAFGTALERLAAQVPLLERALEAQRLHPEILRKLLTLAEADLAALARGDARAPPQKLARGRELQQRTERALASLRARLGEG